MIYKPLFFLLSIVALIMISCAEDDSFSASTANKLTFSTDTVNVDTVFSNVPSSMRSFWVYNHSGDGLRCRSVRLESGGRSGFRVNVDGTYLGETTKYASTDLDVRRDDSVRVFVELTAPQNHAIGPQRIEDNLIFTLESGVEQRVNLSAHSWDAELLKNVHITKDEVIKAQEKPIVVYGGITVDSTATLTIAAGTTIYFHNDSGIKVYGRLLAEGTPTKNIVFRGDRIDRMFSYLPYDFTPGQWQGIRFFTSSYNNKMCYTDIHSTFDGVIVDSADVSKPKLTLQGTAIHNCQGYGLVANNANIIVTNSQFTNTLFDCVYVNGGNVSMNNCTLAQFYPFDGNLGVALRFTSEHPLLALRVSNTLITGYAEQQLLCEQPDSTLTFNYDFDHCFLRMPKVQTADSVHYVDVIFENVKDTTTSGAKHFVKIDTKRLRYDFRLDSASLAIDRANVKTASPIDLNGNRRDKKPDIGAFEYIKM